MSNCKSGEALSLKLHKLWVHIYIQMPSRSTFNKTKKREHIHLNVLLEIHLFFSWEECGQKKKTYKVIACSFHKHNAVVTKGTETGYCSNF